MSQFEYVHTWYACYFDCISAFTLSVLTNAEYCEYLNGQKVMWSIEHCTLLVLSGRHFGHVAEMEGPPVFAKMVAKEAARAEMCCGHYHYIQM